MKISEINSDGMEVGESQEVTNFYFREKKSKEDKFCILDQEGQLEIQLNQYDQVISQFNFLLLPRKF